MSVSVYRWEWGTGPLLLRCTAIEHTSNDGEQDVGYPHREHGRPARVDGKSGRDGLEKDVGETQGNAGADAGTHAALALFARQCDADEGEDEGGKGGGKAFVIFHLKRADACCAAQFLPVDELVELRQRHCFLLVAHKEEVLGLHHDDGVEFGSAFQFLAFSL